MGFDGYFVAATAWMLSLLTIFWTIPWKGYALWTAARRREKWWFIALLVINTMASLEIIYLFAFAKVQDTWKKPGVVGEKPRMPDAPKPPETPAQQ